MTKKLLSVNPIVLIGIGLVYGFVTNPIEMFNVHHPSLWVEFGLTPLFLLIGLEFAAKIKEGHVDRFAFYSAAGSFLPPILLVGCVYLIKGEYFWLGSLPAPTDIIIAAVLCDNMIRFGLINQNVKDYIVSAAIADDGMAAVASPLLRGSTKALVKTFVFSFAAAGAMWVLKRIHAPPLVRLVAVLLFSVIGVLAFHISPLLILVIGCYTGFDAKESHKLEKLPILQIASRVGLLVFGAFSIEWSHLSLSYVFTIETLNFMFGLSLAVCGFMAFFFFAKGNYGSLWQRAAGACVSGAAFTMSLYFLASIPLAYLDNVARAHYQVSIIASSLFMCVLAIVLGIIGKIIVDKNKINENPEDVIPLFI